jgi:hypothetical protein
MPEELQTIQGAAGELIARAEGIERGALRVVGGVTGLSDDDLVGISIFCAIGAGSSWWLYNGFTARYAEPYLISYFEAFRGALIGFGMVGGTAFAVLLYRFIRSSVYRRRLRKELQWLDRRLSTLSTESSTVVADEIELISAQRRRIVQAIADDTLSGLSAGARASRRRDASDVSGPSTVVAK